MLTTTTTTLQSTSTSDITTTTKSKGMLRTGAAAGAVAALATTVIVVIAKSLDVPVAIENKPIPIAGFAQLTFVCALMGTGIAALLTRRSNKARPLFIRIATALTVLSVVPDLTVNTDTATRITLIATHVVAAVIVIPVLARRLANNTFGSLDSDAQ
jgi:Family of unknown function (DUF6069)